MPKTGKKTSPLVSAHWRLRKLILVEGKLERKHVNEVMNSLPLPHQRTSFSKLYGPVCSSKRVCIAKVGRNNVAVLAKEYISPGTRLSELRGQDSIRIPKKDEKKTKSLKYTQYTSVVQREERSKVLRYLIGPLAFANAACTKHSNTSTTKYTSLSTIINEKSEVRKGKELVYYYGKDNPIVELCKGCKEEQKQKKKLTK